MHDRQIEDRLRSALRAEGDALPLTITPDELERRLALRRRARTGGRLRLLAAGIAVVAVGSLAVMAGGWLRPSAVGSGPEASPSPSAPQTAPPTPTSKSSPTPTRSPEPVCEALDPSGSTKPPSLTAGVIPGDSIAFGGTTGAYEWGGTVKGTPGAWTDVAGDPLILSPGTEAITVASDACLAEVRVEALITNTRATEPPPVDLEFTADSGGRVLRIDPPSTGVWLLRVHATFATADGSLAWSETTFGVIVTFDAPELTMRRATGGAGPTADANCPSYQLASGAQAADQCGGAYSVITGLAPLVITSGAAVEFQLGDGWQIDSGRVTAVQSELVRAGAFTPEYSVDYFETGGPTVSVPMVLDPGEWIVRFSLNGSRGEDSFGAWFDFPLVIAE